MQRGNFGAMALDKRFDGDLVATSKGEMLSAVGELKGSAGYVAIERIRGVLEGRSGSFVLLHYRIMTRGAPQLTVTVVPDSGTGQLSGLSGTLTSTSKAENTSTSCCTSSPKHL